MHEPTRPASPLNGPPPWIVGHRGVPTEALENSLESLSLAVEQGADMVELDIQLTADDQLVAVHDWRLDRLAGSDEVVEQSTHAALIARLPALRTLSEILDALPGSLPVNIELKRRLASPERLLRRLAAAIGDRPAILISSFDWSLLGEVRAALPERPLAPIGKVSGDDLLAAADRLGAWSVHCHRSLVSRALVETADAAGRPVLSYTANAADEARALIGLGVSGIFTDAAGRMRRELEMGP